MKDQGIQAVLLGPDKTTVDFEHVWVEALVPFTNYRGGGPDLSIVHCQAQPASCHWIALDPSYKLRQYKGNTLDPYTAPTFDYPSYYKVIKNQDTTRQNKNPLEIYQEQILGWLRTNSPGKNLQDVADLGVISTGQDGILPASLPYAVTSALRCYNAVADHDAVVPSAEAKKWGKAVSINFNMAVTVYGVPYTNSAPVGPILLADMSTRRLTLTTEIVGAIPNLVIRLDDYEVIRFNSFSTAVPGYMPAIGDPFTFAVCMDGAPWPSSGGTDQVITANYSGIIGGYYVIAAGGETGNWTQVHRAKQIA